ncbi:MAG: hypothetical protein CVV42_03010 [Candidatus Riflebacteria bacterium HGW-Riflebacteria-2]|jgi:putative DNA primase/helicase|nr:MAG: hypothetical protein CVV42_03010 [Candidatus Riflebacteria bacterium HGW-Riflebacteria-2]
MNKIDSLESLRDESNSWSEPKPLVAPIMPEPYPIDALPEKIKSAVCEVQSFAQAPIAMIATCALSTVSFAVQGQVDVERSTTLTGPASLFAMIIAESGERKSTIDSYFTTPIYEYQAREQARMKNVRADYVAKKEAWEAEKNGLKELIKNGARKNENTSNPKERLRILENNAPIQPPEAKILFKDVTPEKLLESLAENLPSVCVFSDEAGTVFGSYSMQPDICMRTLSVYNTLWSGGRCSLERKTVKSTEVDGARLTMSLQIQEPAIRSFLDKLGVLARGSGFLARFLVSWPESTQGFRPWKDEPNTWPALESFKNHVAEFLNMPLPIAAGGRLAPAMMKFTQEARQLWIDYYNAVESELKPGGDLDDVRDVASKSADNAARLAACFEVFESGLSSVISSHSMQSATKIARWHLMESKRFLGEIALSEDSPNLARLDEWLLKRCRELNVDRISTGEIMQRGPGGFRLKAKLEPALEGLFNLDRIRVVEVNKRRIVLINPALLSGFKSNDSQ